jgi:hypothetical protein
MKRQKCGCGVAGWLIAALVIVGVAANAKDLMRYIRISSM